MTWTTKELEENIDIWYFAYILELLHYCKKRMLNAYEYNQKLKELENEYEEKLMSIGHSDNAHGRWATLVFMAETKLEDNERFKSHEK